MDKASRCDNTIASAIGDAIVDKMARLAAGGRGGGLDGGLGGARDCGAHGNGLGGGHGAGACGGQSLSAAYAAPASGVQA